MVAQSWVLLVRLLVRQWGSVSSSALIFIHDADKLEISCRGKRLRDMKTEFSFHQFVQLNINRKRRKKKNRKGKRTKEKESGLICNITFFSWSNYSISLLKGERGTVSQELETEVRDIQIKIKAYIFKSKDNEIITERGKGLQLFSSSSL